MLLSFRFSNHRSFRDEQVLDLAPVRGSDDGTGGDTASRDGAAGPAPRGVPVAGIFGVNASGKSNAISALSSMKAMNFFSGIELIPTLDWGRPHPHQPFQLDPESAAGPSRYVADVLLGGVRCTYGFVLEAGRVAEEWLYAYPEQRKRVIFERTGQDIGWGAESAGSDVCRSADNVTPSILLLTRAMRTRAADDAAPDETRSLLRDVSSWLMRKVSVPGQAGMGGDASYQDLAASSAWRATVTAFLRAADLGLEDVAFDERAIEESVASARARHGTERLADEKLRRIMLLTKVRGVEKLRFLHAGTLGSVAFDQADESSGTIKFLELATAAFDALDEGGLLLVDEIDAGLHPLLAAEIVRLFQAPEVNKNGAQLIFTTHDATLLGGIDGRDMLRRDEVWFTRRGADGASQLFPLPEFGPRRQADRQQAEGRERGRHDAIRELSMRMFEQAITSRTDSSAG